MGGYHIWITCSFGAAESGTFRQSTLVCLLASDLCNATDQELTLLNLRRFMIIPEMLKNAPMFKRIDPKSKVLQTPSRPGDRNLSSIAMALQPTNGALHCVSLSNKCTVTGKEWRYWCGRSGSCSCCASASEGGRPGTGCIVCVVELHQMVLGQLQLVAIYSKTYSSQMNVNCR